MQSIWVVIILFKGSVLQHCTFISTQRFSVHCLHVWCLIFEFCRLTQKTNMNNYLLSTLTVDSEVIWTLVGITYSMVKHRPFSSPETKKKFNYVCWNIRKGCQYSKLIKLKTAIKEKLNPHSKHPLAFRKHKTISTVMSQNGKPVSNNNNMLI